MVKSIGRFLTMAEIPEEIHNHYVPDRECECIIGRDGLAGQIIDIYWSRADSKRDRWAFANGKWNLFAWRE